MKQLFITLALVSIAFIGVSQNNMVSLSGGWVWVNIDDSEYFTEDPNIKGSGWRINGTYDYNPNGGNVAYGFTVGYISASASYTDNTDEETTDYSITSIPFYFAPKFMFGSDRVKGFVKLALGAQSATMKKTGAGADLTVSDFGFYGGIGAGLMVFVSEKVFLSGEYEFAYVTNNYYRNGVMQSATIGIGIRF